MAPILTNFFLVTYTLTNAAAALLELSGVPNFRPHWRVYHWGLSLAGAALTLGAMFFLNYVFALITIAIVVLLFVYIYCAFDASRWPDISQALAFAAARRLLLALRRAPDDAKYWRPSVLLLLPADAEPADRDLPPLAFAAAVARGALLVAGRVFTPAGLAAGRGADADGAAASSAAPAPPAAADAVQLARARLSSRVAAAEAAARRDGLPPLGAFELPSVAPTLRDGALQLALGAGIGTVRPDTLALPLLAPAADAGDGAGTTSAPRRPHNLPAADATEYTSVLADCAALRQNALVLANFDGSTPAHTFPLGPAARAGVDVWLFGDLAAAAAEPPAAAAKAVDAAAATGDGDGAHAEVCLAVQYAALAAAAQRRARPSSWRRASVAPAADFAASPLALGDDPAAAAAEAPAVGSLRVVQLGAPTVLPINSGFVALGAPPILPRFRRGATARAAPLRKWLKEAGRRRRRRPRRERGRRGGARRRGRVGVAAGAGRRARAQRRGAPPLVGRRPRVHAAAAAARRRRRRLRRAPPHAHRRAAAHRPLQKRRRPRDDV